LRGKLLKLSLCSVGIWEHDANSPKLLLVAFLEIASVTWFSQVPRVLIPTVNVEIVVPSVENRMTAKVRSASTDDHQVGRAPVKWDCSAVEQVLTEILHAF
jgi:hypothetical protein